MLGEVLNIKEIKPQKFQVLFLRNDSSQGVEVHEVKRVDFNTVQEHLEHGESVFITSNGAQKLKPTRKSSTRKKGRTKLVTAFNLDQFENRS
jgi:hypothetical protein